MDPHVLAWIAAATAVAVGLFALHRLTRTLRWRRSKIVVAVLLAVWLLVPAPVPGFDDHLAPAFLVFFFELLFQQTGHPRTAGVILAASGLLALALMLLATVLLGGRKRS